MAPRQDHVLHLRAHRSRQHDVGIGSGIRDEVLGGDQEQVLVHQAFDDLVGLGRLRHRVRVPAHHRLDRHFQVHFARQRPADLQVVDDLRAFRNEIGTADHVELVGVLPHRELGDAAADMPPCTRQRGNAGHRTDGLAAAMMALQRNADADRRRLRRRQFARQLADVVGGDAGDFRSPLRRARRRALFQGFEAGRCSCRRSPDRPGPAR